MLDPLPKPRISWPLENVTAQSLRYVYDPATAICIKVEPMLSPPYRLGQLAHSHSAQTSREHRQP
jgi:hypothetical protein